MDAIFCPIKTSIMKKFICLLTGLFVLVVMGFTPPVRTLNGNWTISFKSGTKVMLNFAPDGKLVVNIPSEQFTVTGKYKMKDDILYLTDSTCGSGYWGKYTEKFLGNDSVWSVSIEDSCMPRKSSMNNVYMIRTKM
jgi:hypothetical protein